MYKKIFVFIFLILNILLFKFLLSSNDLVGIYKTFNLVLNVISITVLFLYLFNLTKNKLILSIGFFSSFYGILSISSLLSSFLIINIFSNILDNKNLFSYYIILNTLIEFFIVFNIYILFYKERLSVQFQDFFRNKYKSYNYIILFYLVGFILNILFSYLANLIPLVDTTPANQESIEMIMNSLNFKYFYIINLVLIGPLIEEFFFRYMLIEEIFYKIINNNKKIKKIVIILIASFTFALFHAIAAQSFIYFLRDILLYIGTSLALSVAYVKSNNIFVGYFVHVLNNLIAVIIMLNIK